MKATHHIVHVVHGLDVGGMEIMIHRLVKRLDPRRFRSTVCCFDVRGSLAQRTAIGAPAPDNVAAQITRWRSLL